MKQAATQAGSRAAPLHRDRVTKHFAPVGRQNRALACCTPLLKTTNTQPSTSRWAVSGYKKWYFMGAPASEQSTAQPPPARVLARAAATAPSSDLGGTESSASRSLSIPSLYQLISAKPGTHSDLLHILRNPSTQLTVTLCFAKEFGFVERQKRPAQFCWHSRGSRNTVTLTVAAVSVLMFTVLHSTPSPRHLKEAKHTRPALISRSELSHRAKAETVPALCRGPGNKHLLCTKFSVRTKIWNCLF